MEMSSAYWCRILHVFNQEFCVAGVLSFFEGTEYCTVKVPVTVLRYGKLFKRFLHVFSVCGPLICAIFEMSTVEKYSKIKFLVDSFLSQVSLFKNGFSGLQAAVYL